MSFITTLPPPDIQPQLHPPFHPGQLPPHVPPQAMTPQGPPQPQVTQRQVTYQSGELYVGQWLQVTTALGYPHGWGSKYGNDEYYEGQWHEGLKHGLGTRTWSSGETYEGTWRENKRHGYGIQTYIDGTNYEGGWNNDIECGWGTKTKPNNEVYSGGFKDGNEFGIRNYPDGRKYEGGIKDGRANGFGVGHFNEGRKIEGGWKDSKAHGWGTETVGTLKHVGNFANGFWDGPGEQTYDKKVIKGEWSKGKLVETHKAKDGKSKRQPPAGFMYLHIQAGLKKETGHPTKQVSVAIMGERVGYEVETNSLSRSNDPTSILSWDILGDQNLRHKRKIAGGGVGEVHEVRIVNVKHSNVQIYDNHTDKAFARKVIRLFGSISDEEIQNEARAITELSRDGRHRNIVEVFKHGFLLKNSFYYIDMELCDCNLHDYIYKRPEIEWMTDEAAEPAFIERNAPLEEKMLNVRTIMRHLSQGVEYIHHYKQVHRDLKPQNILYSAQENAWKIGDFGCTAEGTSAQPRPTVVSRGTSSYRAPELLHTTPRFTNKTDIWALGCILYELVMFRQAFRSDWETKMYNGSYPIAVKYSQYPEEFEEEINACVNSMIQIEPQNRPDAGQLISHFGPRCQIKSDPPKEEVIRELFEATEQDPEDIIVWKDFVRKFPKLVNFQEQLAHAFRMHGEPKLSNLVLQYISAYDPIQWIYANVEKGAFESPLDIKSAAMHWHDIFTMSRNRWFAPDKLSKLFEERNLKELEIRYWNQLMENDRRYSDRWRTSLPFAYKRTDLTSGLEKWKSLIQMSPSDARLHDEINLIFEWLNAKSEQVEFWQMMMDTHYPSVPSVAEHLAVAFKVGPAEAEIAYWRGKVETNPHDRVIMESLANALKERASSKDEIEMLRELVAKVPDAKWLAGSLADAYERSGQSRAATLCWKDLLSMEPGNVEWQNRLQETLEKMDDHKFQVETWKELVGKHPETVSLHSMLAGALGFKRKGEQTLLKNAVNSVNEEG